MIQDFTAGMTAESFAADPKTNNAVERCLERISEAAKKLEGQAETLCPGNSMATCACSGEYASPRIRPVAASVTCRIKTPKSPNPGYHQKKNSEAIRGSIAGH